MSDDKKSKRGTKTPSGRNSGTGSSGSADRDVGHALRSVYSSTVNEEIPTELLDILGKLR